MLGPKHGSQRGVGGVAFQRNAWAALADGESGLIHAPTGTGKTYAIRLGAITAAQKNSESEPAPASVLWITPLRALAVDTANNLRRPVADLDLPWTVGLRTGDTSSRERTRQRKKLPSAPVFANTRNQAERWAGAG